MLAAKAIQTSIQKFGTDVGVNLPLWHTPKGNGGFFLMLLLNQDCMPWWCSTLVKRELLGSIQE